MPREATTEGSRRLRELLRKHSFAAIARRLRCDAGTIRLWAHEEAKPGLVLRARADESLGIGDGSWDEVPSSDGYGEDPETTRR